MAAAPSPSNPPSALDNGASLYSTDSSMFDPSSVRYDYADADETLWNKSFPYQLAVLELNPTSPVPAGVGVQAASPRYGIHRGLVFTLPVNPESLNNSTPFAIAVSATLGGVVEQHGGAPFRQIVLAGTLGVVSDRPSGNSLQGGRLSGGGGVFAGTLQAAATAAASAAALGTGERFDANLSDETPGPGDGDVKSGSTGYYQFRALQRFLESYAEAKKTAAGRDLRLALFVWKEEAAYLVTPLSLDVVRSAQSPFEYRYSLRLQAWRRVNTKDVLATGGYSSSQNVGVASSFDLTRSYELISRATRTVRAVGNVLLAARQNADQVFTGIRRAALFCAAGGGAVRTAADLPGSIRQDLEGAVREAWDVVSSSFDGRDPHVRRLADAVTVEVADFRSGSASETPTLRAALADDEEADFHDLVKPDSLALNPSAREALDDYTARVLATTSDELKSLADSMLSVAADFADSVGLGDAAYDKLAGRRPLPQVRRATPDDLRAMHALVTAAGAVKSLATNSPTSSVVTPVEYVAGLANANGISMRVPRSKFAVPFPYGYTLERLARQYLGDSSRWTEIAVLNDLRPPYVDEVGSTQQLAANGSGNAIELSDASELQLGQVVQVWSSSVVPEKRRVISVRRLAPTQWHVTLDGAGDLYRLKTSELASVKWFSAGTVNSQQIVYIPSDSPANQDVLKYVPQADDVGRLLTHGEVDGMLTESGDLVVTPDGDWPFVFGYAYLVQWARTALNTPVGSLSLHPDFGVDASVGKSVAESSAKDLLKSVRSVFRFNPTFTGVTHAAIQRAGPTTKVSLELGIRGVDSLLPLDFDVAS